MLHRGFDLRCYGRSIPSRPDRKTLALGGYRTRDLDRTPVRGRFAHERLSSLRWTPAFAGWLIPTRTLHTMSTKNGNRAMKSRTILLATGLALLIAVPAQASRVNITDSYKLAHKVARKLLDAYQAEVAKVVGCYRASYWTGRCTIKLYAVYGTGENCAYAISTHTNHGVTRSSYYADNCPRP